MKDFPFSLVHGLQPGSDLWDSPYCPGQSAPQVKANPFSAIMSISEKAKWVSYSGGFMKDVKSGFGAFWLNYNPCRGESTGLKY
jgi:hypothetical protein